MDVPLSKRQPCPRVPLEKQATPARAGPHSRAAPALRPSSRVQRRGELLKARAAAPDTAPATEPAAAGDAASPREPGVPADIADAVVRLRAPNPAAPDGHTDVYVLGMSHVSKASVDAVRSLVAAVKPEVVLVELCRDRLGLMLNPDSPRDLQLWATRRVRLVGLPTADGWPSEAQVLAVASTEPRRAFTTPDVEADCVALLATGLFRSVRPSFKRPGALDAPQFVRVAGGRLASVPPLGTVEFLVQPRKLPPVASFGARADSSLAGAGIELPTERVAEIERALLRACGTLQAADSSSNSPEVAPEGSKPAEAAAEAAGKPAEAAAADSSSGSSSEAAEQAGKPAEAAGEAAAAAAKQQQQQQQQQRQQQPVPALDALLRARRELAEALRPLVSVPFEISLSGAETGAVEAVVRAPRGQGWTSGLEASALGGAGAGIEPFKPQRGPLQISGNLRIPNLARVLQRRGELSDDWVAAVPPSKALSQWRQWNAEELEAAELAEEDAEEEGWGEKLAGLLSQTYARFQGAAAATVGIQPGAAWREALEAAADHGGLQVHLGDMPADLAARSLAAGIWRGLAARAIGAAAALTAAAAATATHSVPDGAQAWVAGASAVAVAAAAGPFLAPLLEIYLFSRKGAEAIEEAVRIKESLQARGTQMLRLPGEDAIVGWPNARATIIGQRDQYMARTLYAAATGTGASPAFVLDTSGERHAWHYMQPEGAPAGCAKPGAGLGQYQPVPGPRAVVGVVGSAHVGGIVAEWPAAAEQQRLAELLAQGKGSGSGSSSSSEPEIIAN